MNVLSGIGNGMVAVDRPIVWGNCAGFDGDQAFTNAPNVISLDCSDYDSEGISGGGTLILGPDNTTEDPVFCGPPPCTNTSTTAGDFEVFPLGASSPENSPCGELIGGNPITFICPTVTAIPDGTMPEKTELMQNSPNPFNPTTTIRFDLRTAGHVTVNIYDVSGRRVRALVDQTLPAARHQVEWDATDNSGRQVATGVYLMKLIAGDFTQTRKMVLLK